MSHNNIEIKQIPPVTPLSVVEKPLPPLIPDDVVVSDRTWNLPVQIGDLLHLWYPSEANLYLPGPNSSEDYWALIKQLSELPDGTTLPVRSRDTTSPENPAAVTEHSSPEEIEMGYPAVRHYEPWDYGVAVKFSSPSTGPRVFFLQANGRIESYRLASLGFRHQVHFVDPASLDARAMTLTASTLSRRDPDKVVIIAHGWSPHTGPNYPLIRSLEFCVAQHGWYPIVPTFLPTYRMGKLRSRAERVKVCFYP